MFQDFVDAFMGKVQWELIRRRHKADRYIIMPHEQEEYNEYALQYLERYMEKEKIHTVCIFTYDKDVYEKAKSQVFPQGHQVRIFLKRRKWIRNIIKFYALYEFSSKIKIISLTEPYDTCGENLLGVHGITKRELFCYDIFGFAQMPDGGGEEDS